MAYKLGIGHTQNVRRVICKILEMGVSKSGAPRTKRVENFCEHPLCEVRWCINIINLRLPGGGIFYLKYCHVPG